VKRPLLVALVLGWGWGCGDSPPNAEDATPAIAAPESESPVALNGDSPVGYPPALFDQRVEGDVVLRLFVDSTGRLIPESTRVAETSGYPALDSAALAGAPQLRFAPAKRRGIPVATAFLQPIEFRHPNPGAIRSGPPPTATVAPPRVAPRPRPRADSVPPTAPARPDTIIPPPKADTVRTDTSEVAH
jgi:TonB family protein